MDDPEAFETPSVAVLSGGNIDPLLLGKVIQHGMAAAGRYLYLRVVHPRPARRAGRLLTELSEAGANVIEVAHERISPTCTLDEVEVQPAAGDPRPEHADAIVGDGSREQRLPRRRVSAASARSRAPRRRS